MNILTFDIEDWWVYEHYGLGNSIDYLTRLEYYLDLILETLDTKNYKATFFCLGEVAAKYPGIIKKIHARKHHIGCHSYSHTFFTETTREMFSEDTKKALDSIQSITGEKVNSYRAPAFSVTDTNLWILEVLSENGILFDSSIFPAERSFGGIKDFSLKKPCIIEFNGVSIKEFPISITKIFGKESAYSGGGYFRLFPYFKIKSIMKNSDYVMSYFHIKDFDKNQKRVFMKLQGENALERYFKNYYGLRRNLCKFIRLLDEFEFINIEQADKIINWNESKKFKI